MDDSTGTTRGPGHHNYLYHSKQKRRALRRLAMQFSDSCLDVAFSLDCLNDLQLFLLYENFILHLLVDGDQSYHSWRKLGDVVSSLFALGYHEQLGDVRKAPPFLRELCFNCSIFLGRPPRMLKRYCATAHTQETWGVVEHFTYRVDTRVHGICASLQDEILDLAKQDQITKTQNLGCDATDYAWKRYTNVCSDIRATAEVEWAALPAAFRLDKSLSSCDERPVELDFLVSTKLIFAHIIFLLELNMTPRISHPGAELLRLSADMLCVIIEAIVLRQRLANSGMSLVWKVAYYGLAAAGVLCLALLYNTFDLANSDATPAKAIRDLGVLVAEIEAGAFVQPEDPNFALLSGAAHTIKNLLD
ncbi:hypothetical protein EK21DRAFT_104174 [Setomelanomma holmii]|uniref:Uncharacterized protein n=1 Tax=Setomelanomma holmii TaxID=210430 RepID=A0A9P4H119_9PLEO|nr:hypothetical protein EK21DRAFT_104174 [Setomelanomma holmii]